VINVNPSPGHNNTGDDVTYTFTVDGSSTNNCNYVDGTILPNLNEWGQGEIENLSNVDFNAQVSNCDNNNGNKRQNGGSTWTIVVTLSGTNADNTVQSESFFANLIQLQLQSDSSVTVNNISVERSSGFLMQASLLALLSVALTALMV